MDVDGNEYIEYGMGLRAVTLGHAFPAVIEAIRRQLDFGSNFTRHAAIELECAERLSDLIRSAEMVKFAKNGSDATSAAVRLSRAYTGRDMIAICGDQPFFCVEDWFIGSTAMSAGIPESIRNLTVKFQFNNLESIRQLFEKFPDRIACVILEPATALEPADGFLAGLKALCEKNGAVLVFDEMITGFRWDLGGAQKYYGVQPHLSTFGKGLANGFSVSALVGKKEIMALGGLCHDKERVFLLSTTHGAETHELAAATETMRIYEESDVIARLYSQGCRLKKGIDNVICENRLEGFFEVLGKMPNLIFATRDERGQPSQLFRTLFLQETIKRGLLMPSLVVSYSHSDADIDRTIAAIGEALVVYRKALEGGAEKYLIGRPVKPVFRRFN